LKHEWSIIMIKHDVEICHAPKPKKEDAKPEDTADAEDAARDPAAERGERIDTGKQIARGGKEDGAVPGAEPAKK